MLNTIINFLKGIGALILVLSIVTLMLWGMKIFYKELGLFLVLIAPLFWIGYFIYNLISTINSSAVDKYDRIGACIMAIIIGFIYIFFFRYGYSEFILETMEYLTFLN